MVGLGWSGCSSRAFRWTEAEGMAALPNSGSGSSRANSISGDGTLIGGWDEGGNGGRRAVLWGGKEFTQNFLLAGQPGNAAGAGEVQGINRDGSIVVGWGSSIDPATNGPFVYREGKGVTYLATSQAPSPSCPVHSI
jgi:uncharacterized membrane protein